MLSKHFLIRKLHPLIGAIILSSTWLLCCTATATSLAVNQQRMIVLTDIEADPDDAQSLVRLLLYSNQIDIQGLIATTSVHQKTMVAPQSIRSIINAYAKVRNNLSKHELGFPRASGLQALVKTGLPIYGMAGVGPGRDSEGSEWIIKTLEQKDERPLWISVWGGANTLAQALYQLKATRTAAELNKLIKKLRVYTISDQDDSGAWMRREFPELFYIVSPGGYGAATWTGISHVVEGIDNNSISNSWLAENVQQGHGPLGAQYPDVAYGMEGDTPSWLNLLPFGLSMPERPDYGGWGGRYTLAIPNKENTDPNGFTGGVPIHQETRAIWTNTSDRYTPMRYAKFGRSLQAGTASFEGFRVTLWRWRDDFQNDFAARMDWCINEYTHANHPPQIKLQHPEIMTVNSEAGFHLDARGTQDPDGDNLTFLWFNYAEAGSMKGEPIPIASAPNMVRVYVQAPKVTQAQELHFILKVTDKGKPPLTRYRRVIVKVLAPV